MGFVAAAIGLYDLGQGLMSSKDTYLNQLDQVDLGYKDSLEKIRRRAFEQKQTQGTAKAFSESSGVRHVGGSTAQGYLDTMAREFSMEIDWMKSYAEEARRLGVKSAQISYSANRWNSLTGAINTGAGVYGMGGGG